MTTSFSGVPVRPFVNTDVNANSACVIDYSCRNLDNELEEPTALRYRIDNLTDCRVIADWQTVADPGSTGSVVVSAELNAMSTQFRDRQLNQVTFEATFANGQKVQELCAYQLCAMYQGQLSS